MPTNPCLKCAKQDDVCRYVCEKYIIYTEAKQKANEKHRQYYKILKEKGVCARCGKPIPAERKGSIYCAECAEEHRKSEKADRDYYLSKGICPVCRRNDLIGFAKSCVECREKRRAKGDNRTKEQKAAKMRRRYQRLKEKGVCVKCGKEHSNGNKVLCKYCLEKMRVARHEREGWKMMRSNRMENDLCFICGKNPVLDGYKVCKSCHDEMAERLYKSNKERRDRNEINRFEMSMWRFYSIPRLMPKGYKELQPNKKPERND